MTAAAHGPLTCKVQRTREAVFLRLSGDFDLSAEQTFTAAYAGQLAQRPLAIVIDLAGVDFLDSTGVRCMIMASRDAASAAVRLSLQGAHGIVAQVLQMTGVAEAVANAQPVSAVPVTPASATRSGALWARLRKLAGR